MKVIPFILLSILGPVAALGQGVVASAPLSNPSMGTSAMSISCTAASGGVTVGKLVVDPGTGICSVAPSGTTGAIGVAQSTATNGTIFQVAVLGTVTVGCVADGTWVQGDLLAPSTTVAGDCHDTGFSARDSIPITTQIIGKAMAACSVGVACLMNTSGVGHSGASVGLTSAATATIGNGAFAGSTIVCAPGYTCSAKKARWALTVGSQGPPTGNVLFTVATGLPVTAVCSAVYNPSSNVADLIAVGGTGETTGGFSVDVQATQTLNSGDTVWVDTFCDTP
jgi:hypothetical protein